VILGAALLREEFPVSPRHTAVIATLTVGLPSLALASWALPGQSSRSLLGPALAFILPAGITIGLASLAVYAGFSLTDRATGEARTALTATSTFCGLALIPYATLPISTWLTPAPLAAAPKQVALALAMLALFVLSSSVSFLRDFYELDVLQPLDYVYVLLAVVLWAFGLKAAWSRLPSSLWDRLERVVSRHSVSPA